MKNRIKHFAKQLIRRRKIRLVLWVLFVPVSFLAIWIYQLFDFEWYKSQFADDPKWIKNRDKALLHYILHGRRRGLTPSPFFTPEYFDSRNWQGSVVDPLTRYLIQKKNWTSPTSIIFHPQRASAGPGWLSAPLVGFLKRLDDDTVIELDIDGAEPKNWSDMKSNLYLSNENYKNQEELRRSSSPVGEFDFDFEEKEIQKYVDAKLQAKNKSTPLVSIIMPVWNRQELVVDAIESVQAQTFQDWELVITDDGSTDSSIDVIKKLQKNDDRIKLFQPGHGGVCKARNNSIQESRGEWIAFLDSDNTWTPYYLQTMIASVINQASKAAYSAIKMENKGQVRYRTTKPNPEILETGNYIDLNALVVHRSVIDEIGVFDESLRRMVDYDLVCRISEKTDFIYVPVIGVLYADHEDASRITTNELLSWDGVIKNKNFIDYEASMDGRDSKRISIIVPVQNDVRTAIRCLKALIVELDGRDDVEIVVVDSSSTSAMNTTLGVLSDSTKTLSIENVRIPGSHDNTLGSNYGFTRSMGGTVVFIDQRMLVEAGFLDPLVERVRLGGGIVGPVQLKPSRWIHSAGEVFAGDAITPIHLLENHPISDLGELSDYYEVPALTSGCMAIRAEDFARLSGFNPLYDKGFETHDICLRAAGQGIKSTVAKQSVVSRFDDKRGWNSSSQKTFYAEWVGKIEKNNGQNLWSDAGFKVVGYVRDEKDAEFGQLTPKLQLISEHRRRWAIKISAPADERRFAWGDLYYAEALAAALEQHGQRVAIDFHNYHQRPTSYLDDVLLDLRGLDGTKPQEGAINIMWVISHPDKVTTETVRGFDKVYAAGKRWAEYMTDKSGINVEFLPQCTDPEVFHPTVKNSDFIGKALFVGNSRNAMRPIVADAIDAGLDVMVYGGGWAGLIDDQYIHGSFIANDKLAEAYSSADFVLNDHWEDMRNWGFISNRIFDAAASGATVVTDDVYGLKDLVSIGTVMVYNNTSDLQAEKLQSFKDSNDETVSESAVRAVVKNHSFKSRAHKMVQYVNER